MGEKLRVIGRKMLAHSVHLLVVAHRLEAYATLGASRYMGKVIFATRQGHERDYDTLAIFPKFVVIILALANGFASAAAIQIVATGDSITNGYGGGGFLQRRLRDEGFDAHVTTVASGGASSVHYVGQVVDPNTNTVRHMDQEVVDVAPDAILFMLGTNDALRNIFPTYQEHISRVFDRFQQAENSRGDASSVFLLTPIPLLAYPTADQRLIDQFNPWLRGQAGQRNWKLIDIRSSIQLVENWTTFYNDGVHLWANNGVGYQWMAGEIVNTIRRAKVPGLINGDFDHNGQLTIEDLNMLTSELVSRKSRLVFDVNFDDQIDRGDHRHWVGSLARYSYGDANLDGQFATSDLVALFEAGQYEDAIPFNSTWTTGDFNGDGDFSTADLVLVFETTSISPPDYLEQHRGTSAVPEPAWACGEYMALVILMRIRTCHRRRRPRTLEHI